MPPNNPRTFNTLRPRMPLPLQFSIGNFRLFSNLLAGLLKLVGKPGAGNRHARFDERGWETGRCRMAQATAPPGQFEARAACTIRFDKRGQIVIRKQKRRQGVPTAARV